MYFIYIFSIAVGSMADFRGLLAHINGPLLLFVTLSVFGSLLLPPLLARLFKIDADTVIVTSVAAILLAAFRAGRGRRPQPQPVARGSTRASSATPSANFAGVSIAYVLRLLLKLGPDPPGEGAGRRRVRGSWRPVSVYPKGRGFAACIRGAGAPCVREAVASR